MVGHHKYMEQTDREVIVKRKVVYKMDSFGASRKENYGINPIEQARDITIAGGNQSKMMENNWALNIFL